MSDLRIAPADPADAAAWLALRDALWPGARTEHEGEIAATLAALPAADRRILLAFADGAPIGLAEAALRHDYVNGCDTTPVVFLEGLYVAASHRRRGIARALVAAVVAWGEELGYAELASDAPLDNAVSHRLHASLGFEETERVVFFRRPLAA